MSHAILAVVFLVVAALYGAAAFHYGAWCQRRFEDTRPIRKSLERIDSEMDEALERARERHSGRVSSEESEHPAGAPPPMPRKAQRWKIPGIS